VWLALLVSIREVPNSNVGLETIVIESFRDFTQSLQAYFYCNLKNDHCFKLPFQFVFHIYHTIRCCVTFIVQKALLNNPEYNPVGASLVVNAAL
jgi:hypothetical protein